MVVRIEDDADLRWWVLLPHAQRPRTHGRAAAGQQGRGSSGLGAGGCGGREPRPQPQQQPQQLQACSMQVPPAEAACLALALLHQSRSQDWMLHAGAAESQQQKQQQEVILPSQAIQMACGTDVPHLPACQTAYEQPCPNSGHAVNGPEQRAPTQQTQMQRKLHPAAGEAISSGTSTSTAPAPPAFPPGACPLAFQQDVCLLHSGGHAGAARGKRGAPCQGCGAEQHAGREGRGDGEEAGGSNASMAHPVLLWALSRSLPSKPRTTHARARGDVAGLASCCCCSDKEEEEEESSTRTEGNAVLQPPRVQPQQVGRRWLHRWRFVRGGNWLVLPSCVLLHTVQAGFPETCRAHALADTGAGKALALQQQLAIALPTMKELCLVSPLSDLCCVEPEAWVYTHTALNARPP